jgi:hypothetical protein
MRYFREVRKFTHSGEVTSPPSYFLSGSTERVLKKFCDGTLYTNILVRIGTYRPTLFAVAVEYLLVIPWSARDKENLCTPQRSTSFVTGSFLSGGC